MARKKDREKARHLRLRGKSYSEIKEKLGISKSTLSNWLHEYPLSNERIRELRDYNPKRIENFRNTMRRKREKRLQEVYKKVERDFSDITKNNLFLAGFFLYWAEGTKTAKTTTSLANTDPAMIQFFIKWLEMLGISKSKLRVKLHLYSDMNIKKEAKFWSQEIRIPLSQFRKPYIKKTKTKEIKYKGGFGRGTCNIILDSRDATEYISMGIKYIKDTYC